MENEAREYFPKVCTTKAQKYFVEEVLLQKMSEAGLIERANFSEFVRASIKKSAKDLGIMIDTPTYKKQKQGRKKKTEVVLM